MCCMYCMDFDTIEIRCKEKLEMCGYSNKEFNIKDFKQAAF